VRPLVFVLSVPLALAALVACAKGPDALATGWPGDVPPPWDAGGPTTTEREAGVTIPPHTADAADAAGVETRDAAAADGGDVASDAGPSRDDAGNAADGATDSATDSAASTIDAASGAPSQDSGADAPPAGVVSGGPCLSGALGATAFRVRWTNAGGSAQASYDVDGMPDRSQDQAGAYGYQVGFTASFVDTALAEGGLALDSSDFVDIRLSTAGLSSIVSATLAIYGRSYSVDTSGGFSWQTLDGSWQTPLDVVSNAAPYQWYSANMTPEIGPNEPNVLLRIKAGPSSNALVVNQIELCLLAD
jgi:hypothetical protein